MDAHRNVLVVEEGHQRSKHVDVLHAVRVGEISQRVVVGGTEVDRHACCRFAKLLNDRHGGQSSYALT